MTLFLCVCPPSMGFRQSDEKKLCSVTVLEFSSCYRVLVRVATSKNSLSVVSDTNSCFPRVFSSLFAISTKQNDFPRPRDGKNCGIIRIFRIVEFYDFGFVK